MPSDFPGLKRRRNKDGTARLYWVARPDLCKAGYRPRTVPLHYDWSDESQHSLISSACMKLQAEMLEWSAGRKDTHRPFDGTVAALVRLYQTDEASPYKRLKWNTRRTYDQVLETLENAFGERALVCLGLKDFRRWYDAARKPKTPGGAQRVRKAHGLIGMVRRLVSYGVAAELAECARLAAILRETSFEQPAQRRTRLTLQHVEAFISAAIAQGRFSLALGTALQFETTLRQRDVIGEWEPIEEGQERSGIVLRGRRWVNGLTWSDALSNDFEIYKETTKTGAIAAHDLKLCPLVMKVVGMIPADRRVGPLIVDEEAGRPYAEHAYAREWRVIADAAGVPQGVWNMDARAGGISEADDAGAALDDIRSQAAHAQAATTARYVRGTIGKSRKVAKLRAAHRAERQSND
ncbi:integrase [Methylocystis sp. JAN1]|uniref:integrase n=1 Tax=Methylocystis sp. JAN1 TaxID=3397211 RepID=UPI003FA258CE